MKAPEILAAAAAAATSVFLQSCSSHIRPVEGETLRAATVAQHETPPGGKAPVADRAAPPRRKAPRGEAVSPAVKSRAIACARRFLTVVGMNGGTAKVRRVDHPAGSPLVRLSFDRRREVWISTPSMRPVRFRDGRRLVEYGGGRVTRTTPFRSKDEVRRRLQQIVRGIGTNPRAKLVDANIDLGRPGRRSYRLIEAWWDWPEDGMKVYVTFHGVYINLDPATGVPMDFEAGEEVRIQKSNLRISADRAKQIALGEAKHRQDATVERPELVYAPDPEARGDVKTLRRAWMVEVLEDMAYWVFIDAETGKVFGIVPPGTK